MTQYTTPSGAIVDETGKLIQGPPSSASQNTTPNISLATPAPPTIPTGASTDQNQGITGDLTSNTASPTTTTPNLAPGASGADVASLQKFLMSLGFNIPAIQGGQAQPGYFGPQTQSALSQFQQKYGLNAGQYAGYFGPQTKSLIAQNQDLAKQFQSFFDQKKETEPPQNDADARSAVSDLQENTPPDYFQEFQDSYMAMNSVIKGLYDTLQQIMQSTTNKTSFVDMYNQLRTQMDIPGLNTELLNIKKVMRGTEQDIRDEITKAGGTATESQIQAMTSTRNRLLQNQAIAITDQLQVANDYVDNVVKFTQADRKEVWDQLDRQIGLSEKIATIQTDLNNASRTNYEKIVTNIGYDGLANAIGDNPTQQRYVEGLLGLRGGALSDPVWLENAKTFRQQQLGLAQGGMMRAIVDPLTGEIIYYYSKPPAGGQPGPVGGGGVTPTPTVPTPTVPTPTVPTPTKPPAWLQSAIETAAGIQYIDATKLKGQAQQYQAQTWAAQNNIAFLAPDDAKEVQKANQTYQSTLTLIKKIKEYSTKVLTASNSKLSMGEQAARLYIIEHAPMLSTDNDAKEYISARNALVTIMTRSVGQEKGALANLDVARFYSALPGYTDNKDLAQNKANNLDDVIKSVFQGSINAYVTNSGGYNTPKNLPETIRVRIKKTGKTGSIPANEFDSTIYEKI